MKKNKTYILISIMILSMYLNIEQMIPLMYTGISAAFPNATLVEVQKIYSICMLTELFTNFLVGWFASKLSKRKILILFQGLTVLGGLIAFFFGKTLAILYATSIMIGFAAAIVSTISKSVITENFSGDEATKVFSGQQMAQSIGTMGLQIVAGIWAVSSWKNVYLTFLFGLLSLISAMFMLPEGPLEKPNIDENGKRAKIWTKALVHDVICTGLFVMLFVNYSSNITFLVSEKNFGNVAIAGYLSAIWTAVLFIAAMMLGKVTRKFGKWTIGICFATEAIAFVVIGLSNNMYITVVAIVAAAFAQGIFSPTMYMNVPKHADPGNITSSMAMINASASLGIYLLPYLCTFPASFFGSTAQSRFIFVAAEIAILFIYEIFYQRNNKKESAQH